MRSLWSGTISFGLVSVPVRMGWRPSPRSSASNFLHKDEGTPMRRQAAGKRAHKAS